MLYHCSIVADTVWHDKLQLNTLHCSLPCKGYFYGVSTVLASSPQLYTQDVEKKSPQQCHLGRCTGFGVKSHGTNWILEHVKFGT